MVEHPEEPEPARPRGLEDVPAVGGAHPAAAEQRGAPAVRGLVGHAQEVVLGAGRPRGHAEVRMGGAERVHEEPPLPPEEGKAKAAMYVIDGAHSVAFLESLRSDERKPALQLDKTSLEVHGVDRVEIKSMPYPVTHHRIQRSPMRRPR